jgi:starch synthase
MEGLHTLLLQSVEPWDDIICASPAIKSVVQTQRDCQVAFIEGRFGAIRVPAPQLPVVPLRVNAHDFEYVSAGMVRLRQFCEVKDKTIIVMSRGRLTAVEKGNPAPLFMTLEDIAQDN